MDYTTEEFTVWLKTQPLGATYDYCSSENCMFAQFLKHLGHQNVSVTPRHWVSNRGMGNISYEVNQACHREIVGLALSYLEFVGGNNGST